MARIGRKEIDRKTSSDHECRRQAMAELPAEQKNGKIEWRIEPLPEVNCDPGLMKLVFTNLLSNAVKFTRTRQIAVIEVGTRTAMADRRYSLCATTEWASTPSMPISSLEFPAPASAGGLRRTGIGLATVQRIIHRHGGEIWAESELGRGTTFFFTLGASAPGIELETEVKLGRV